MKYAILENGIQVEWHNNDMVTILPTNAIELTDDEWDNRLACTPDQLLTNAKTNAKSALISARQEFQYKNISYNGTIYSASESAQNKLANKIANGTFPFQWSGSSGNIQSLTQNQALALQAIMLAQEDSSYLQASGYLSQINTCTTVDQVQALTFNFS